MLAAGKAKKPGKRGRKPAKIDLKAKLERSRQSARECRARKKLRYQYLEELVSSKERAICALREELDMVSVRKRPRPPDLLADVALFFCSQYKQWCSAMDRGKIPAEIRALLTADDQHRGPATAGSGTKTLKSAKTQSNA